MPIYEYECPRGHRWEEFESVFAPIWHWCAQHGETAQRVPSVCNANFGAVIQPSDVHYTPRMETYLGHRRWREKYEKQLATERQSKYPVVSYRTRPAHCEPKKKPSTDSGDTQG